MVDILSFSAVTESRRDFKSRLEEASQ